MKRALLGLAVTAFTVLAFSGSASAATGPVTHVRISWTCSTALSQPTSPTSGISTLIIVSQSRQASELLADQFTINVDANGNIIGATDTRADVTSGFAFAFHQPLASASLTGSGLPAQT